MHLCASLYILTRLKYGFQSWYRNAKTKKSPVFPRRTLFPYGVYQCWCLQNCTMVHSCIFVCTSAPSNVCIRWNCTWSQGATTLAYIFLYLLPQDFAIHICHYSSQRKVSCPWTWNMNIQCCDARKRPALELARPHPQNGRAPPYPTSPTTVQCVKPTPESIHGDASGLENTSSDKI